MVQGVDQGTIDMTVASVRGSKHGEGVTVMTLVVQGSGEGRLTPNKSVY